MRLSISESLQIKIDYGRIQIKNLCFVGTKFILISTTEKHFFSNHINEFSLFFSQFRQMGEFSREFS